MGLLQNWTKLPDDRSLTFQDFDGTRHILASDVDASMFETRSGILTVTELDDAIIQPVQVFHVDKLKIHTFRDRDFESNRVYVQSSSDGV